MRFTLKKEQNKKCKRTYDESKNPNVFLIMIAIKKKCLSNLNGSYFLLKKI